MDPPSSPSSPSRRARSNGNSAFSQNSLMTGSTSSRTKRRVLLRYSISASPRSQRISRKSVPSASLSSSGEMPPPFAATVSVIVRLLLADLAPSESETAPFQRAGKRAPVSARRGRATEVAGCRPMESADYVIVGAGSAGCILANRLTEDPGVRVVLLEAGGRDRSPNIKIPAAFAPQFHTKLDWEYYTEPEPAVNGRELYLPRGKSLGGSS